METEKFTRDRAILELIRYCTSASFAMLLGGSTTDEELKEWLILFEISKNPEII